MPDRYAYFCGDWLLERELAIPLGDFGFTMGITVTERLRTFGGKVFRKAEHLTRLGRSLEAIGLDEQQIVPEVDTAIDEFCDRHRDLFGPADDWGIVAFATPGSGDAPTVCVHGAPLAFAQWADQFSTGARVVVSEHRQVPPSCWPPGLKCRSRMHYYLAEREARQHHPQARAVLLDQDGFVGEASTANLVMVDKANGLSTPKRTKVLPGVSVAVIAELAQALGVAFAERDISPDELVAADEVWLASTSICMLPVVTLDDRPIGTGKPGPVYDRFLAAWSDLVGVDIAAQARQFAERR